MSVCVSTSSALSGPCPAIDMTMSQMSLGSTAAMMHSIAHQMQQQVAPPPSQTNPNMHPLSLVNGHPSSSMDQTLHPPPHAAPGQISDPNEPNPEMLLALIARNKALEATIPKCGGCHDYILDRFILKVSDRTWHAKCLQCIECHAQLNEKCFAKNGQLFCKTDFFKRYGTKCSVCELGIAPTDVVRRAHDNVYHLECFSCSMCSRQLKTGDEFYLMEDRKLVCKPDYEAAKAKGLYLSDGSLDGEGSNKRPRTTITAKQLETLKSAYNSSPKPARHVREQLSQDTGLDMRVVQVWFQNRRAKEKRLKKDAGRTRWSQYFRSIKAGGSSPRDKSFDKDDLKVDLDSFSHDLSNDSYSTVNMGLEDGTSPHSGRNSYLSSHSPTPGMGSNHAYASYSDNVVYTSIGQSGILPHGMNSNAVSDLSNDSSPPHGYPDFPPSPDSWLGDSSTNTGVTPVPVPINGQNSSTSVSNVAQPPGTMAHY